ncbi:HAMP domain-containing histidine kinase [Bermanella marisrubri]|uniref:histidine kinase n=1 Tax=Bermanella marisrubri TaxID=207949 RepID=Q1N0D2_9GAMM|nr:ATP-binding protein [Bermanella marisrubri]EAT11732.1 probable two-component sensor [Oceanobacter sp. RED65] [Bermanella marisrubri]QIZ83236.1 HAMP domain-containing histidine kinase [Bermanella marisrubri]
MNEAVKHNLRRLAKLRLIMVAAAAAGYALIGIESSPWQQQITIYLCLLLLLVLGCVNYLHGRRPSPIPERLEMSASLFADVFLVAGLIYFSGGANNPFISYLLVPIVISAATLGWLITWMLCLLAITLYGVLLFFYQPLLSLDLQLHHMGLSLHITGMWLTFSISAIFIAYFVVDMALELFHQTQQNAGYREQLMQQEHIMMLANQAASTAHEIGTPLTSIQITINELIKWETDLSAESRQDLALIKEQIQLCKSKLQSLTQQHESNDRGAENIVEFIEQTLQQWLLLFPNGKYTWLKPMTRCEKQVQYPPVIAQAIVNLLQNAALANPAKAIELQVTFHSSGWQLSIYDQGQGNAQLISDNLMLAPKGPSNQGLGIGLILSRHSILQSGGKLQFKQRENLGVETQVTLPWDQTS